MCARSVSQSRQKRREDRTGTDAPHEQASPRPDVSQSFHLWICSYSSSMDIRDLERKVGREVPEGLMRSLSGASEGRSTATHAQGLHTLAGKLLFLRQQMAHLRAIDVKLMQQLLSINEGIESIRWVMEERGGAASRESSSTGSLYSLSDSQDASLHGSCSDGLDGISVGSYLDTLGEDDPDSSSPSNLLDGSNGKAAIEEEMFTKPPLQPRVDTDEYYCFA